MRRLIQKGLMFGNLVPVRSAALVGRYNRALKHLTGKSTELTDFHIDISGYSPEIGLELKDPLYLNHAGVNRQFILLTTEQKRAPLLDAKFSTSRDILRQFIDANEPQLFALTAQDAVAGELVNSVYDASEPSRLFDVRKVTIEADTTRETVAKAQELADRIETFTTERDRWFDDVLIAEMIGLAKQTGDVTRNPVRLKEMSFSQASYWTAHFGGVYLFRDVEHPAVICTDKDDLGDVPMDFVFDLNDRRHIAHFLRLNDLVEPILEARGVDSAAVLRQKMDFILIDKAADAGEDLSRTDRRGLRALARQYARDLPQEYRGLAALHRWAVDGGDWPTVTADHPAYFYTLRASEGPHTALVNRLLAQLTPKDIRQLFICHKELFYQVYSGWVDAKKAYVADYLEREYQVDKAGAREALFGFDEPMKEPEPRRGNGPWDHSEKTKNGRGSDTDDMIRRVGPWGSIRR